MMFVKATLNGETRRLSCKPRFRKLREAVCEAFGYAPGKVSLFYKDEEGDLISLKGREDFEEALRSLDDDAVFRVDVVAEASDTEDHAAPRAVGNNFEVDGPSYKGAISMKPRLKGEIQALAVPQGKVETVAVAPGVPLMHSWRIRNESDVAWPAGVALIRAHPLKLAEKMQAPESVAVPSLAPGEETIVSVSLTAPTSIGTHRAWFRMEHLETKRRFGHRLPVVLDVVEGSSSGGESADEKTEETMPSKSALKMKGLALNPKVTALAVPQGKVETVAVAPGVPLMHSWRIRNESDVAWPAGVALVRANPVKLAEKMQAPESVAVPSLAPGEETIVSVSLTAPTSIGTHRAWFRMEHLETKRRFGHRLPVVLDVVEGSSSGGESADEKTEEAVKAMGRRGPGFKFLKRALMLRGGMVKHCNKAVCHGKKLKRRIIARLLESVVDPSSSSSSSSSSEEEKEVNDSDVQVMTSRLNAVCSQLRALRIERDELRTKLKEAKVAAKVAAKEKKNAEKLEKHVAKAQAKSAAAKAVASDSSDQASAFDALFVKAGPGKKLKACKPDPQV